MTRYLVAFSCLITALGCKNIEEAKNFRFPWQDKVAYDVPMRMAETWTYDVLSVPGRPPTPGFGGRIYFYNKKSQAISVDGELTVYVYDDSDVIETGAPPRAKYRFTAEQFTKHLKETDLGGSYNVWIPIPWHDRFGETTNVTLIPVFIDATGQRVAGRPTGNTLPGQIKLKDGEKPKRFIRQADGSFAPDEESNDTRVTPASYTASVRRSIDKLKSSYRLKSTTIPLPATMVERTRRNLNNGSPQHISLVGQPGSANQAAPVGNQQWANSIRVANAKAAAATRQASTAQQRASTANGGVQLGAPILGTPVRNQKIAATSPDQGSVGEQRPGVRSSPRRHRVQGARVSRPANDLLR